MKVIYYGIEKEEYSEYYSHEPYDYYMYSNEEKIKFLTKEIEIMDNRLFKCHRVIKHDVPVKEFNRNIEYAEVLKVGEYIEIDGKEYDIKHTAYDQKTDTLKVYTDYVTNLRKESEGQYNVEKAKHIEGLEFNIKYLKQLIKEEAEKKHSKKKWYQFWK